MPRKPKNPETENEVEVETAGEHIGTDSAPRPAGAKLYYFAGGSYEGHTKDMKAKISLQRGDTLLLTDEEYNNLRERLKEKLVGPDGWVKIRKNLEKRGVQFSTGGNK